MVRDSASLLRDGDFRALWVGTTLSQTGTQVTFVALPLVAVLALEADAQQLGVLRFVEYLPLLMLTPLFGVLADRRRRRSLMLASYAVRGVLIALVPALVLFDQLHLWLLLVIAFGVGAGTALYDVCWISYVPRLVDSRRLTDAMSRMAAGNVAAEVAGPGLGGLLVQLLTAPFALLLDALSYVVGGWSLLRIRRREPSPERSPAGLRRRFHELVEGIRFAFAEPHIRATALTAALGNFFALVTETVFLVYAIRDLHFTPGLLGLVLTAIGAGGLLGATFAGAVVARWPVGRVYVTARLVGGAGAMLVPLAAGPTVTVVAMCMGSFLLVQAALANTNVINASLRQALTPDSLRGRMNASVRTLVAGMLPLGALAATILSGFLGLQTILWVGAIGYAASIVPVLASPLPRLNTIPTVAAREEVSDARP